MHLQMRLGETPGLTARSPVCPHYGILVNSHSRQQHLTCDPHQGEKEEQERKSQTSLEGALGMGVASSGRPPLQWVEVCVPPYVKV